MDESTDMLGETRLGVHYSDLKHLVKTTPKCVPVDKWFVLLTTNFFQGLSA